jgi:glycosyltransferase involved in cell wall biosynthesis
VQVRVLEMARALEKHGCEIGILGVHGDSESGGVGRPIPPRRQELERFKADVWVCPPLLLPRYRRLLGMCPLVLDCYEAPFASFLHYAASRPPSRRKAAHTSYRREMATYMWAGGRANALLAANERQQASLATLLAMFGWLDAFEPVERRVLIVPSGVPSDLVTDDRRRYSFLQGQGPVVLWAGGAYPWFDVDIVAEASELVLDELPSARFLFAGLHGRDEALGTEQRAGLCLQRAIEQSPRLRRQTTFVPWLPYAERKDLYASADVALSVHGAQVETYFSMRGRVLDFVGAQLPLVASGGDTLTEELGRAGAASLVPPGNSHGLARALLALLRSPAEREAMRTAMRQVAIDHLSWDRALEPLLLLCDGVPGVRSQKAYPRVQAPPRVYLRAARELWVLPAQSARQRLRPLVRR